MRMSVRAGTHVHTHSCKHARTHKHKHARAHIHIHTHVPCSKALATVWVDIKGKKAFHTTLLNQLYMDVRELVQV